MYRTIRTLLHTPIVPVVVKSPVTTEMTTFRAAYSTSSKSDSPEKDSPGLRDEASASTGPSTDRVAHTDSAYKGGASSQEGKRNVEQETGQSMEQSSANSGSSSSPSGSAPHNTPGSKSGQKAPSSS